MPESWSNDPAQGVSQGLALLDITQQEAITVVSHNIFTYRLDKRKHILFNGFSRLQEEGKSKYNFYSAIEEVETKEEKQRVELNSLYLNFFHKELRHLIDKSKEKNRAKFK